MADVDNKQIDIEQTSAGQPEQVTPVKPRLRGFERRFMLYDRIKLSVKTIDIIILVAVILLIVTFILGVYKR